MTFTGRYTVARQFEFVQATPASTWTIVHPIGGYPIVDVFVTDPSTSDVTRILPSQITYVDAKTITITFSQALTGTASLVG